MVSTNDTAELALVGTRGGQTVICTHHFRMTEVGTGRTLQDLIDKWQAAAQAAWLAILTSDYTLQKVRARHVCGSVPLDATVEETVNAAGSRGAATAATPPWFALVIRERTASAGRERRGRFYVPVCDEADFAGDTIQAGILANYTAYAAALTGAFLPGGSQIGTWQMVVHSRKLAAVPGTQCQASSTVVTSLPVQAVLTTQRSRRQRPA